MAISTKSRRKDEGDAAPSAFRARRRRVVGAASLDLVEGAPNDEALQSSLEENHETTMLSSLGSVEEPEASPTDDRIAPPAAFAQFPLVRLDGEEAITEGQEGATEAPQYDAVREGTEQGAKDVQGKQGKKAIKPRKVRSEADREQQRRVATAQRLRHDELVRTWMPSQRGANMALATRIGSQTVEGWFKRTFVRLSRMLYRIHTFPMHQVAPEAIARLEAEVLGVIGKGEGALSQQAGRCEEMLERVGGRKAFFSKHFELEIIISTKTAMALHAVYHRADEVMLLVESLDFAGILTEQQRRKQIGTIHASIFSLAQSIERLHRGLYVRAAKAFTEVGETDAVAAAAAGGPVDLGEGLVEAKETIASATDG